MVFFVVLILGGLYTLFWMLSDSQHTHSVQEEQRKNDAYIPQMKPKRRDVQMVILSPVRNAMQGLPFALENVTRIQQVFPNTRCVFIENDSTDGTREFLENEFSSRVPTKILDGPHSVKAPRVGRSCHRVSRMALLRNTLLQEVQPEDELFVFYDADWRTTIPLPEFVRAVDYMMDHPEVNGAIPMLMGRLPWFPWLRVYWDTFAYKDNHTKPMAQNERSRYLQTRNNWNQGEPMQVDSAFGCLGIYRNVGEPLPQYIPRELPNSNGDCECEHVSFNEQMAPIHLLPWFKIYA